MFLNEILHLLLTPAVYRAIQRNCVFCCKIFNNFVCTEAFMTFLAIHQRIREASKMSGCYPGLGIHENRTVNSYIIGIFHDEFLPPCLFYIVLQFHTKVTVIPGVGKTSVNLGTGIYKPSCLRQCNNFLHRFFHSTHTFRSFYLINYFIDTEYMPVLPHSLFVLHSCHYRM